MKETLIYIFIKIIDFICFASFIVFTISLTIGLIFNYLYIFENYTIYEKYYQMMLLSMNISLSLFIILVTICSFFATKKG